MKATINLTIIYITISIFITSCIGNIGNDKKDRNQNVNLETLETEVYDLTSRGIPTTIEGPAGATISNGMSGGEYDGFVTTSLLIDGGNLKLEVNIDSQPSGRSLAELITWYKELDRDNENDQFEIIREETDGYIYKSVVMGDPSYLIRHIKMNSKGEALEMESGFSFPDYTLEEAEKILEFAKTATWD